jgi:hypothetical protein
MHQYYAVITFQTLDIVQTQMPFDFTLLAYTALGYSSELTNVLGEISDRLGKSATTFEVLRELQSA